MSSKIKKAGYVRGNLSIKFLGGLVFGLSLLLTGSFCFAQISNLLTRLPDQPKINAELTEIEKLQEVAKSDTKKYLYTAPIKIDNVVYTTHEYVTANGDIGYQVIIDTGSDIISTATGSEAESRTFTISKKNIELQNYEAID